jgi:hypothetical protein
LSTRNLSVDETLFTFDNLPDDKDAEFLVRSRPFFELEFDNVALKPKSDD